MGSTRDWLLVFEQIIFNGDHFNQVFSFGSNCKKNGLVYAEEVLFFPDFPYDDKGNFFISPFDIHVQMKNEEIKIKPTMEDYFAAGIDPNPFGPTKLLRFLCYLYGHKFWLDDKTLLQAAGVEKDMKLFFRTEKWRHIAGLEDPSENEFFQQLALAIEKKDTSLIRIQDPNTHWSHWVYSDFPDD